MKTYRSSKTGKFLLDGASRIVASPSMEKTRTKVAAGSIAGDWKAVGTDIRKSMSTARKRLECA